MWHKPVEHGTPPGSPGRTLGSIIQGLSIMLFAFIVGSMVIGGILGEDTYQYVMCLGLVCLVGYGVGAVIKGA